MVVFIMFLGSNISELIYNTVDGLIFVGYQFSSF